MSTTQEVDEIITVDETIEKGYFYLENRHFHGPFDSEEEASKAALANCDLSTPGQCRAIYNGSAKRSLDTNLNEPMADMRQTSTVQCPTADMAVESTSSTTILA